MFRASRNRGSSGTLLTFLLTHRLAEAVRSPDQATPDGSKHAGQGHDPAVRDIARQRLQPPHNPKVAGSNPAPATNEEAQVRAHFSEWAFCIQGCLLPDLLPNAPARPVIRRYPTAPASENRLILGGRRRYGRGCELGRRCERSRGCCAGLDRSRRGHARPVGQPAAPAPVDRDASTPRAAGARRADFGRRQDAGAVGADCARLAGPWTARPGSRCEAGTGVDGVVGHGAACGREAPRTRPGP